MHPRLAHQDFYCRKFLRRLGLFGGDGFCLCSGDDFSAGTDPAEARGLPLLICSAAFAYALGIDNYDSLPGISVISLFVRAT